MSVYQENLAAQHERGVGEQQYEKEGDHTFESFMGETTVNRSDSLQSESHIRLQSVAHLSIPLKTPDKRLLSSENTSHGGVRKRLTPPSPYHCDSVDSKQRQVAKCLQFTSAPKLEALPVRTTLARCLFGVPRQEDNEIVRRNYENHVEQEYQQFQERYTIICKVDDL